MLNERKKSMNTVAIIVAAGLGKRMQHRLPKVFLPLGRRPLLAHTLAPFEQCPLVREIMIVVPRGYEVRCWREIVEQYSCRKVSAVIHGGRERQDSVYAALKLLPPTTGLVAIHDGARPLVTTVIIARSIRVACRYGAAVTAMPVKDTIKQVKGGRIAATLRRSELWAMQTPQVFRYPLVRRAYDQARRRRVTATDDAFLVEQTGQAVAVVEGSYENIKVTTPEDLAMAETLLRWRK
jgi:2-C-methyl-D-erythritol 4-phosphate cytidylyltransferase